MRQNYEYLARIFCRRIRRHWLWNYPWALEFVWEDHAQAEERKYIVWFLKIIVIVWLVTNYRGLRGMRKWGWYWEDVHVIRQHTTQYCISMHTQTHKNIKEYTTDAYEIYTCNYCRGQVTLDIHSNYDNLKQLNPHVRCSVAHLSYVCREVWRMCMFVLADSFIWPSYNIHMAPPNCTPFPPAMYFHLPWYDCVATHMEIGQKYQVCINHVN